MIIRRGQGFLVYGFAVRGLWIIGITQIQNLGTAIPYTTKGF